MNQSKVRDPRFWVIWKKSGALPRSMQQQLLDLANSLAAASPLVLRMAHNEDNVTTAVAMDAAHFLKLNEKRLGRDIELYGFMGKMGGWEDSNRRKTVRAQS